MPPNETPNIGGPHCAHSKVHYRPVYSQPGSVESAKWICIGCMAEFVPVGAALFELAALKTSHAALEREVERLRAALQAMLDQYDEINTDACVQAREALHAE